MIYIYRRLTGMAGGTAIAGQDGAAFRLNGTAQHLIPPAAGIRGHRENG